MGCLCEWNLGEGGCNQEQSVYRFRQWLLCEGPAATPRPHTHLAQIHTATGKLRREQQVNCRHRRLHCEGPAARRLLSRHLLAQQCHQQPPVPVMCDLGVGEEVWRCGRA